LDKLLNLHLTAVFLYHRLLIIVVILLVTVYSCACRSVLVLIIVDWAQMAEKFQQAKNTTKRWQKTKTAATSSASDEVVCVRPQSWNCSPRTDSHKQK